MNAPRRKHVLRDMLSFEPQHVLRLVLTLRVVAATAYLCGLALMVAHGLRVPAWVWLIPMTLLAVNAACWNQLDFEVNAAPASLSMHLAADCLALFALLWGTGGATNPFVSLFLVPVAIGGVVLPPRHAVALTGWCLVGYTFLLLRYLETGSMHISVAGFERHVIGMWLNFMLAASLLCVFLLAVSAALRAREREIAAQRERLLRDDAILSVATVTAGAAHALNTPLNTIALAAESLEAHPALPADVRAEVAAISTQVTLCAEQLHHIVDSHRTTGTLRRALPDYAADLVANWRTRRPEIESEVSGLLDLPAIPMRDDPALSQALVNLLDNAAEASMAADSTRVGIAWSCDAADQRDRIDASLDLMIDDDGRDAASTVLSDPVASSTKAEGHGLGLTLARASIVRLGGRLTFARTPGGGTRTHARLPIARLADPVDAGDD